MPSYEIDVNKIYDIPNEIKVVKHNDKIIVIAPAFANWIILNSSTQLEIFEFLRAGHSIKDTLNSTLFDEKDVNYIVTQIEARKLCNKIIHNATVEERSMHLYLTNLCNLSCPHCYMFSGKAHDNELTTKEILKLISDYKTIAKGTSITLSGGEPTSHADFDLIVQAAAEQGLEVKILTNGTQMTPEKVAKLAKYIYSVQISLDGFSEESNSLIRGKGSFQKALRAIDLFVNHGIDTAVAITPPIKLLEHSTIEYISFAKKLALKYQDKPFKIKFTDELLTGRNINPSSSQNKEYYSLMKKIQEGLYGPNYDVMSFVDMLYHNTILNNCMFGNFAVASNGDVYYCARIGDLMPFANIRNTTIKEIYEKSLIAERATLITRLKPCNLCELRYICGGGCRIEEFPKLVKKTSFDDFDVSNVAQRHCNQSIKEKFYDLMIRSNKYFYTPIR